MKTTDHVFKDERAYWLFEGWVLKGELWPYESRRIQKIIVIRDDEQALYEEDLGPLENYKQGDRTRGSFTIPSFMEFSVGELREIADWMREGDYSPVNPREPTNLLERYARQLDEEEQQRAHRTTVGSSITVQRS